MNNTATSTTNTTAAAEGGEGDLMNIDKLMTLVERELAPYSEAEDLVEVPIVDGMRNKIYELYDEVIAYTVKDLKRIKFFNSVVYHLDKMLSLEYYSLEDWLKCYYSLTKLKEYIDAETYHKVAAKGGRRKLEYIPLSDDL